VLRLFAAFAGAVNPPKPDYGRELQSLSVRLGNWVMSAGAQADERSNIMGRKT